MIKSTRYSGFKKISGRVIVALILFFSINSVHANYNPEMVEQRLEKLISSMTLEQKVGQMVQGNITHVTPDDVSRYFLGSVLNGGGSWPNGRKESSIYDWLTAADNYFQASLDTRYGSAGIPIIWGTDAVHGHNNVKGATLFPHNVALGAARNVELVREIGEATAREVSVTGLDWVFAPTIAVSIDRRWGRAYESYSDDPELVGSYASAMVLGLQGSLGQLSEPGRVIATAKHFIGDGGTIRGVDQGDTRLGLDALLKIHGLGYKKAIEANAQTIMASFNSWNGKKIHGSKQLLTDVLKTDMDFDGFVVGDWDGHGQVDGCKNTSCPQAILAGIDMFMVPKQWKKFIANTLRQVRGGEIPISRIDDAVRRILRVKIRAGLFSKGLPSQRVLAGDLALVGSQEHRALARRAVRESLVLLKNNAGILPLRGKLRILVGGDGAHSVAKQSGGWTLSWQGNKNIPTDFPGATSIFEGLKKAVEDIDGSAELATNDSWRDGFNPDVAVLVFGEDPYAEGVGDREDLLFCDSHTDNLRLLSRLRERGVPVVSVMLTGRPLVVNAQINQSDAFVVAWLPGSEGDGIADVLVADKSGRPRFDFTGTLPFSWPDAETPERDTDLPAELMIFKRGYGKSYSDKEYLKADLTELACAPKELKPLVIFSGTTRKPFTAYVADSLDDIVSVSGASTASLSQSLSVMTLDGDVQEDSRLVTWNGESDIGSEFFWRSSSVLDWRDFLDQDAALSMTFKVIKHPEGAVTQEIDCGVSCNSELEMAPFFKTVPEDQWVRAATPLRCFAKAGADLSQVRSPFILRTKKAFSLVIKDLRVVTDLPKSALIRCD
ncbi:MAG: beta-glucosidase [Cellvibrionales bacterium TMED49]|nr:beta-glucosidase [Porticoccaceae bacterium]OUU37713.1 MAG: beta-glucosidase [Cellvibrionales bacterium TMED49]